MRLRHGRRGAMAAAVAVVCGAGGASAGDPAAYVNPEDFSSEALFATGLTTCGARAAGLGGATAAIADDAFALVQNPAGLAQLVKIEIAAGLRTEQRDATFDMFEARAPASEPASGIDAVAFAYPVPTYRGSLVLGGGVFRARTTESASARRDLRSGPAFQFDDEFLRRQRGDVWQFTAGAAVDVQRSLSLGLTVSYWYATLRDEQFRHIDEVFTGALPAFEDRLQTETSLGGVSFDTGLLAYAGSGTRIGLVLRSPVWAWLDGSGSFTHTSLASGSTRTDALFIAQRPELPWSAAFGASYARRGWLVAAETRYVAWDELDLDVPPAPGTPPGADPDYTGRLEARAGLECALPHLPVRVRAGFAQEPLAYDLLLGRAASRIQDRRTWSAGAGVAVGRALAFDLAFTSTRAERADRDEPAVRETLREERVLFSGSYRY